jgi:glutamate dehydrogenase/leucine dehydrogenase
MTSTVETANPFVVAQEQLDKAAKVLRLQPHVHEALRNPIKEFTFQIPVRMDDGSVKWFRGWRPG